MALDGCPIGLHHCERGGPATNHQPTSDAQAQLGSHLRWRVRIDPSVWERSNGRNLAGRAAHGVLNRSGVELGEGTSMVWTSGCIHCQQPGRYRDRGRQVSSAAAVTWPHCARASFCGGPTLHDCVRTLASQPFGLGRTPPAASSQVCPPARPTVPIGGQNRTWASSLFATEAAEATPPTAGRRRCFPPSRRPTAMRSKVNTHTFRADFRRRRSS